MGVFKKAIKGNTFYRYVFSYVVILLSAMMGAFVLYTFFLNVYRKEVLTNTSMQLNQMKTVVDTQLVQITNISQQIFENPDLTSFDFIDDTLRGVQAKTELQKYALSTLLVEDLFFYPGSGEYIFSYKTSISIDAFNARYRLHSNDAKTLFDEIIDTRAQTVLPASRITVNIEGQSPELITIAFADYKYNTKGQRRVTFFLNEKDILAMLTSNSPAEWSNVILFDQYDNIVSTPLPYEDTVALLPQIQPDGGSEIGQLVTLGGVEYFSIVCKSSDTQWTYAVLIDPEVAFQSVYYVKKVMLLCFGVVFVVGMGLCWLWAALNYAPIKELKNFADSTSNEAASGGNELASVRKALSSLHSRNQSLSLKIEKSSDAVKESLLYSAIKGKFASAEEFNAKGQDVGLSFPWEHYSVAVFRGGYASDTFALELSLFAHTIENSLPAHILGYARTYNEPCTLVMVLCCETDDASALYAAVSDCRSLLSEKAGVPVAVGVGRLCTKPANIPRVYIEAKSALEYRFLRGESSTILFEDIKKSQDPVDAAMRHIPEKIDTIFRDNELFRLNHFLTNTVAYLRESNISLFSAKMICYDLVNTIAKNIDAKYYAMNSATIERPNVFSISSFETIDELLELLIQTNLDLSVWMEHDPADKELSVTEQMTAYIRDNCSDSSFSISNMADHFGMSASNLSQFFKSKMGETVLDFATELRLNRAKDLLVTTNIPLQDIAIEVGYYNVTSFIRRFKQQCGQTPGEYRKNA